MRTATQLSGISVGEVLDKSLPDIVTAVTDEWIEVAPDRVIETFSGCLIRMNLMLFSFLI